MRGGGACFFFCYSMNQKPVYMCVGERWERVSLSRPLSSACGDRNFFLSSCFFKNIIHNYEYLLPTINDTKVFFETLFGTRDIQKKMLFTKISLNI
jgi:hypothetical protein